MLRKTLTVALVAILLQTTGLVLTIPAAPPNEKEAARVEKVRSDVMRLGNQARVKVKLTDDTTLDGRISEIAAEYFVITDDRSGSLITVTYREAKQVKRNNLSRGEKIGIGVAIGVGVGILIAVLAGRHKNNDNNEPKCVLTSQVGVPCPPGCVCIAQ